MIYLFLLKKTIENDFFYFLFMHSISVFHFAPKPKDIIVIYPGREPLNKNPKSLVHGFLTSFLQSECEKWGDRRRRRMLTLFFTLSALLTSLHLITSRSSLSLSSLCWWSVWFFRATVKWLNLFADHWSIHSVRRRHRSDSGLARIYLTCSIMLG